MSEFGEANVQIKPISDIVLECACCPDTFLRRPEIISESRSFRHDLCISISAGEWGIDPRKTRFQKKLTRSGGGSRLVESTSKEGINLGICPLVVTESDVADPALEKDAELKWDGDLPPTYRIRTEDYGDKVTRWSDPVHASAIRPIIDDGIINTEWGNRKFGLSRYSYLTESSRARVIEGRSIVRVELQSADLLWRFTADITLKWVRFIPQSPVGRTPPDLEPMYEDVTETVTVDFLLDFVNEDERFYNMGQRTRLETDWFYIKDMAIEAGLEIPPDDSYTLTFSNATITQEVTNLIPP